MPLPITALQSQTTMFQHYHIVRNDVKTNEQLDRKKPTTGNCHVNILFAELASLSSTMLAYSSKAQTTTVFNLTTKKLL